MSEIPKIRVTPRAAAALRNRTHPVAFAKPREFYDRERGLYFVTDGVASTGKPSPQGTVTHVEHRSDSGRQDAHIRPRTIRALLTPEGEIIQWPMRK